MIEKNRKIVHFIVMQYGMKTVENISDYDLLVLEISL